MVEIPLLCAKYNRSYFALSLETQVTKECTFLKLCLEQHMQARIQSETWVWQPAESPRVIGTLSKGEVPVTKRVNSIRPPYWLWNLVIHWRTD